MNLRMFKYNFDSGKFTIKSQFSIMPDDITDIEMFSEVRARDSKCQTMAEVKAYYERITQMHIKKHNVRWMYP